MSPLSAGDVLDKEYLQLRAKILELAASLDRIDRASGSIDGDSRYALLRQGIEALSSSEEGRAERIQLLFSLPYVEDWRARFGLDAKK